MLLAGNTCGERVTEPEVLVDRMMAGDRRALARLMTLIECEDPDTGTVFARLFRHVGRARRVGVTGPPGAGKSTLVGRMIRAIRAAGETVGVLAVDPSSPVSGGALLGDRLRMGELDDPAVFVRSMASRGSSGGLARQSLDLADLLDTFGRDWIFIETVGTGQNEIEVIHESDIVLVVIHPGAGDSIQAMKAGLFEVGDVFAVNKADRSGAKALKSDLEWSFHLRESGAAPPVFLTSATEDQGIDEVVAALRERHEQMISGGTLREARLSRMKKRLHRHVGEAFDRHLSMDPEWKGLMENLAERVMNLEMDRYSAYDEVSEFLDRRTGRNKEQQGRSGE